jgi:uncharacterized RDD family membrane protein YckC
VEILTETILNRRVIAFIIDLTLMGIILGFYMLLITSLLVEKELDYFSFKYTFAFYLGTSVIVVCKDIFGGRSIGKIIRKLEVRDIETKKRISTSKAILRNIPFLFLGPIELFIGIFKNNHRRVGDIMSRTEVTLQKEK